jgi:hypothetical protein
MIEAAPGSSAIRKPPTAQPRHSPGKPAALHLCVPQSLVPDFSTYIPNPVDIQMPFLPRKHTHITPLLCPKSVDFTPDSVLFGADGTPFSSQTEPSAPCPSQLGTGERWMLQPEKVHSSQTPTCSEMLVNKRQIARCRSTFGKRDSRSRLDLLQVVSRRPIGISAVIASIGDGLGHSVCTFSPRPRCRPATARLRSVSACRRWT